MRFEINIVGLRKITTDWETLQPGERATKSRSAINEDSGTPTLILKTDAQAGFFFLPDFCNKICQLQTSAPQQKASLFDHIVGTGELLERHV